MHNSIPGQFGTLGGIPAIYALDEVFYNPVADMINSVPPGESTRMLPVDLSIDVFQVISETWKRNRKNCK